MLFKIAIVAFVALAGFTSFLYWKNGRLSAEVAAYEEAAQKMKQALGTCNARIENIRKDAESDREIDNLPDLRKFPIPDRWMLPP